MARDPNAELWMRQAVDLGKRSVAEDDRPLPLVGVVAVRDDEVIGSGYRGATGPGEHGEYGMLKRSGVVDFAGATIYTTLEPCSKRGPGKLPCASHLIRAGVGAVYIGMYDPNPTIYRAGWRALRDAGIVLYDFTPELRAEVKRDNEAFLQSFRVGVGQSGSARFDYTQNGGRYVIEADRTTFTTRWTARGEGSIYALDYANHVASARYADSFAEIDDPGALDYSNYTVPVEEGQIVVFRTDARYLLVKITRVICAPSGHHELAFDYETRTRAVG